MEFLLVLLGMLAAWRLTHMLQEENGPWAIFSRLQAWIGNFKNNKYGSFNDGFFCFYCLSVWVSLFVALAIEHTNWAHFALYWMAISTGAIFLDLTHQRLEQ